MGALHWLIDLLKDPGPVIRWGGYPILFAIIFAETGALIFFLPGDSLLFVAGMYAARGDLNIVVLNALLVVAACLGPITSYQVGKVMGPRLFSRPDSFLFKPKHLEAAQAFYDRHGGKAIILARFMPIVRTFVPVVAGAGRMDYRRYALNSVIGGVSWIVSMTLLGFFLGRFEWIGKNIEKVIIGIVVLSLIPAFVGWLRQRRAASAT